MDRFSRTTVKGAPPVYRPGPRAVAGPPVYRPLQNVNPSVQPKAAEYLAPKSRSAPPVYRPQPGRIAQPKVTGNFRSETRPAPPVYRPQPASATQRFQACVGARPQPNANIRQK